MKITVLVSNIYKVGGVQTVINTLFNNISKDKKYEITILSLFKTNKNPILTYNERIKFEYLFNGNLNIKKNFLKITYALNSFLKNNKTDILIVSGIGFSSIVRLATFKMSKLKVIGWEHQQFNYGKKFGLEWSGKRIALKYFDSLVVLTKEDLEQYTNNIKNISGFKKIKQIYNPINYKMENKEYLKKSKKIISVGTLDYRKGFDLAIEVGTKLLKKYPKWEWHIYGDGILRKSLQESINNKQLQNQMVLMGRDDNISKKYQDYSFLVMTSRNEGFPITLIEAKSKELPIVSFDCKSGPKELIDDGINGYLVPCFDINLMVQKITTLIENEEMRVSFSKQASKNLEKLDLDLITSQWKSLFNSVYKGE